MEEVAQLREAVERLTARVTRLETAESAAPAVLGDSSIDSEIFWILEGLKKRSSESGAVAYAGAVTVAAGPVEWQIALSTDQVLEMAWSSFAPTIAALGHPVRLSLMQAILSGAGSVAELGAGEGMGTTGQLYHHLGHLVSQGWLLAAGRGHYSIPPERVVPLMVILAAARRFS